MFDKCWYSPHSLPKKAVPYGDTGTGAHEDKSPSACTDLHQLPGGEGAGYQLPLVWMNKKEEGTERVFSPLSYWRLRKVKGPPTMIDQ